MCWAHIVSKHGNWCRPYTQLPSCYIEQRLNTESTGQVIPISYSRKTLPIQQCLSAHSADVAACVWLYDMGWYYDETLGQHAYIQNRPLNNYAANTYGIPCKRTNESIRSSSINGTIMLAKNNSYELFLERYWTSWDIYELVAFIDIDHQILKSRVCPLRLNLIFSEWTPVTHFSRAGRPGD